MSSVDNRIVEMKFNNADFERRIASTIASLEKLNSTIDMTAGKKALSDLADQTKKFDLNPLGSAIEGISGKFLAMSAVGITVLANLTNRAVDAGINLGKALSLDQVMAGFREYETNMNSIQTVLANTKQDGTTLNDVNTALDTLNEYSDKTIYNFSEMARNIGTFTAAGVDLDTSVDSIKGIANLAAISGSSSQQASTAMYQLSQAIASGSLKLMDWNSVVNAGMGGQVMQSALFETGKAMGTLTDVPIDQTFEEWKDAGNTFRDSLQDGWITTDVLTTALKGFSGEMTDAELATLGFTEAQIANIQEMGQTGVEAATKVRTLSQLIDTTKEAVASGWSQSFRTIFGDFEEATELFSGVSDAISGMVSNSSEARNEMLTGWAEMGGRADLIEGIKNAFLALSEIMAPIKEAFRDIFPPMTAERLAELTERFREITEAMRPSEETVDRLGRTFKGLFAAFDIGLEIVKGVWGLFTDLFGLISGPGSDGILATTANFGDFIVGLREILVDGGAIKEWFSDLKDFVKDPIPAIQELIDKVDDFLQSVGVDLPGIWEKLGDLIPPDIIAGVTKGLAKGKDAIVEFAQGLIDRAKEILGISSPSKVFEQIGRFIVEGLVKGLEAGYALITAAFDAAMDADLFNKAWSAAKKLWEVISKIVDKFREVFDFPSLTTLFAFSGAATSGGIFILLKKLSDVFGKNGLGAIKDSVVGTLDSLSGVLQAMALDIKAGALLKIAGAIALLTASVLVLSMIDSDALAKGLGAMAVGFGQLMGSFAAFQQISIGKGSLSMIGLALGLTVLAGAVLLLALAARAMAGLSWEELGRGLTGVTALLAGMAATSQLMDTQTPGMFRTAGAMVVLALAIGLLGVALKIFSMMSWSELAQGFAAVAVGLGLIVAATNLMPRDMAMRTAGLIGVAVAMNLIAAAVKLFSMMSWADMAKGLIGVGLGLTAMGFALRAMPPTMAITGGAIFIIAAAMLLLARSIAKLAELSWEDIAKGVLTISGTLFVLAKAIKAIDGKATLGGAVSLLLMSFALGNLGKVLTAFSEIPFGTLFSGLLKMGIALAAIAGASVLLGPAVVPMLVLGGALLALGAGFALIGVGADLVARAARVMVSLGDAAGDAILLLLKTVGKALPALAQGFALGLLDIANMLLDAAPGLLDKLGGVLMQMLDKVIELIPKIKDTMLAFIRAGLETIRDTSAEFIATGYGLLIDFLAGLRDNIGEITMVVADIVIEFLKALEDKVPEMVDGFVSLLTTVFLETARGLGEIAGTLLLGVGQSFIGGFWTGIWGQVTRLKDNIMGFINDVIGWFKSGFGIFSPSRVMDALGVDLMVGLMNGIVDGAKAVINWFKNLASATLGWIGSLVGTLTGKGWDLLTGFLTGVKNFARDILHFYFIGFPAMIVGWVGDLGTLLKTKGWNLLVGFYNGIVDFVNEKLIPWFSGIKDKILGWIGDAGSMLFTTGWNIIVGLKNGIAAKWGEFSGWLKGKVDGLVDLVKAPWNIFSPSRTAMDIGGYIVEGLTLGMHKKMNDPADEIGSITSNMQKALIKGTQKVNAATEGIGRSIEMVITPVLDLDGFYRETARLNGALPAGYSYAQAAGIASTRFDTEALLGEAGDSGLKFEQNIYAPKQLSTADIYRQSRNLITLAKEELEIA